MDKETLNKIATKGLPMPFSVSKDKGTLVSDAAARHEEQITQMGLVVQETISAIGEVKIERIEMVGDKRGIIMDLDAEGLVGTLFEPDEGKVPVRYWDLIKELRVKPAAVAPLRRMAIVDAAILDKIKAILQDYVGDFTERIYKNQMKNQGINVDELHAEDVRRLILALAKATSMIVGRSKGRELSKKLTELVK